MRQPDYNRAKRKATAILARQDLKGRTTDVRTFKLDRPIYFLPVQQYCGCIGMTYEDAKASGLADGCIIGDKKYGIYTIIYNETENPRMLFTLAHELGHIYLNHDDVDDAVDEREADVFASQLLMPDYSIVRMAYDYGKVNPQIVSEVFGTSLTAAKIKLHSLKQSNGIQYSQDDIDVYEMQLPKIKAFYDCDSVITFRMEIKQMYETDRDRNIKEIQNQIERWAVERELAIEEIRHIRKKAKRELLKEMYCLA